MPVTSEKQKRLMDAAAHNPAFAKKVGVPTKVAKEFSKESKGMKFKEGGEMKESKVKMARGGGIEKKGKTKGTMVKMARGGGIEIRGKTKGKMLARGGKC